MAAVKAACASGESTPAMPRQMAATASQDLPQPVRVAAIAQKTKLITVSAVVCMHVCCQDVATFALEHVISGRQTTMSVKGCS